METSYKEDTFLYVDNFGIKSYSPEDVHHLVDVLKFQCTAKIDYTGNNFLGFTLKRNYEKDTWI